MVDATDRKWLLCKIFELGNKTFNMVVWSASQECGIGNEECFVVPLVAATPHYTKFYCAQNRFCGHWSLIESQFVFNAT